MPAFTEDIQIEYGGSPRLILYSRGDGTQKYSIRSTNNGDSAGGARLIVRNESYGTDVLTITGGGGAASDKVGIGTTNPQEKLEVVGNVRVAAQGIESHNANSATLSFVVRQGSIREVPITGGIDIEGHTTLDRTSRTQSHKPLNLLIFLFLGYIVLKNN